MGKEQMMGRNWADPRKAGEGRGKTLGGEGMGKERANLLNGRQIAGMGEGRTGCWAVNRARMEGEADRKGEETLMGVCSPRLISRVVPKKEMRACRDA